MGEGYTASLVALGLVFIIGFLIPICLMGFIPNEDETHDYSSISSKITNEAGGQLFQSEAKSFFQTQIAVFKYLPQEVSIPLLIIVLVSVIYAVVKLILP